MVNGLFMFLGFGSLIMVVSLGVVSQDWRRGSLYDGTDFLGGCPQRLSSDKRVAESGLRETMFVGSGCRDLNMILLTAESRSQMLGD